MQISPVVSSIFFKQLNSALLARFFFNSLLTVQVLNVFGIGGKQKNLLVLDIAGFFFRMSYQVQALVLCTSVLVRKKRNPLYPIQPLLLFQQYCILYLLLFKSEIQDNHQNQYAQYNILFTPKLYRIDHVISSLLHLFLVLISNPRWPPLWNILSFQKAYQLFLLTSMYMLDNKIKFLCGWQIVCSIPGLVKHKSKIGIC